MIIEGNLRMMRTEYDNPVKYYLPVGAEEIELNKLIGQKIRLKYKGQINCINCGRKTKTSFSQGYCYPCFLKVPQTAACIISPQLCEAHLGIYRDKEFAEDICLKDHFVYLALTSAVKVGVTRATQIPKRWIDQGAWKAIKFAKTPNRNLAGQIEVELKQHMTDKTNWRHMLSNKLNTILDLSEEKERIKKLLPEKFLKYFSTENEITEIEYPVIDYPQKVKSLNFEKQDEIKLVLKGIKGQYLIFENGQVINMRKHAGYLVEIEI